MSDPGRIARLISERDRLERDKRVMNWLLWNGHSAELATILQMSYEHETLDDLFRFMDWAIDRRLLMAIPASIDQDGDIMPF